MNRLVMILGTCWALGVGAPSLEAVTSSPLQEKIAEFDATSGSQSVGGAAMIDAVGQLRTLVDFPICLEEVEYDRSLHPLTLSTALKRLLDLQEAGSLSSLDRLRLERYEVLAEQVPDPDSYLLGIDKRIFSISRTDATVQEILDLLIDADPDYVWQNRGDTASPFIVIRPKAASVLDWPIESYCAEKPRLAEAYAPSGRITAALSSHHISLILGAQDFPEERLDLCRSKQTAEDVLNETARVAGKRFSWTLAGTAGARFLGFGSE